MQKTANRAKSSSSYTRPKLQKSATLSRKYVRKPAARRVMDIKKADKKAEDKIAPKIQKVAVKVPVTTSAKVAAKAPAKAVANKVQLKTPSFKTTAKAKDLKKSISDSSKHTPIKINKIERAKLIKRFDSPKVAKSVAAKKTAATKPVLKPAIKSASASKASSDAARLAMRQVANMDSTNKPMKKRRGARFFVAIGCSLAAVAGLVAFVVSNIPNISVKVAAMQTGIDAEYPDYVPRGYTMETVAADKDNKITMRFTGPGDAYFVLTEENSTWDSAAVLNNFVKLNYSANYATMHEQGITYYSDAGSAVWVNGGILYKLSSFSKNLTREQIRNLVVSL